MGLIREAQQELTVQTQEIEQEAAGLRGRLQALVGDDADPQYQIERVGLTLALEAAEKRLLVARDSLRPRQAALQALQTERVRRQAQAAEFLAEYAPFVQLAELALPIFEAHYKEIGRSAGDRQIVRLPLGPMVFLRVPGEEAYQFFMQVTRQARAYESLKARLLDLGDD